MRPIRSSGTSTSAASTEVNQRCSPGVRSVGSTRVQARIAGRRSRVTAQRTEDLLAARTVQPAGETLDLIDVLTVDHRRHHIGTIVATHALDWLGALDGAYPAAP